jgi:hypothetical protein
MLIVEKSYRTKLLSLFSGMIAVLFVLVCLNIHQTSKQVIQHAKEKSCTLQVQNPSIACSFSVVKTIPSFLCFHGFELPVWQLITSADASVVKQNSIAVICIFLEIFSRIHPNKAP